MNRRLSNDHFQRRPDSTVQKMTAARRAVACSNHHMGMEHWIAVLFYNVPVKGKDLHLFLYGNFLIALLFSVKKAKRRFTEGSDGSDVRSSQPIFSGKSQQRFFYFVILIEYEREGLQAVFSMQQFRFHKAAFVIT